MNQIARGIVWHHRLAPVKHRLHYAMAYLVLDVDSLDQKRSLPSVAFNRIGLVSLWEKDYLRGERTGTIRSRIERFLQDAGIDFKPSRMEWVTLPRMLGYGFNPVSFYLLKDAQDLLRGCLAEVNNTFGERHLYVMGPDQLRDGTEGWSRATLPKVFHVSPFNSVEGEYEFQFHCTPNSYCIRIDLRRDGLVVFKSGMELVDVVPLSNYHVVGTLARMPLSWLGTTTRIIWHALLLRVLRHLPAFDKPEPKSVWTIFRGKQIWIQRVLFPKSGV